MVTADTVAVEHRVWGQRNALRRAFPGADLTLIASTLVELWFGQDHPQQERFRDEAYELIKTPCPFKRIRMALRHEALIAGLYMSFHSQCKVAGL